MKDGYEMLVAYFRSLYSCLFILPKPQDLLLTQKFVRRMKSIKHKTVDGQIFEKAVNLGPYCTYHDAI